MDWWPRTGRCQRVCDCRLVNGWCYLFFGWPFFKSWKTIQQVVKWLYVASRYSCLSWEVWGVVEGSNFDNSWIWARGALSSYRCPTVSAKVSSDWRLKIASCKLLWMSFHVAKCIFRKNHNNVWITPSNVLTFATVALECSLCLFVNLIFKGTTIAPSCRIQNLFP